MSQYRLSACLATLQEAGEALFVPSCWHHVVRNEVATLSINHNWLNGHNLHWVWGLLRAQYREAAAMIEDCRWGCAGVSCYCVLCGLMPALSLERVQEATGPAALLSRLLKCLQVGSQ
jgi:hypothetical protein